MRKAIKAIASIMAALVFCMGLDPAFVKAAVKIASDFGDVILTEGDVSENLYLAEVFTLDGETFVGEIRDYNYGRFYATSDDLVNWQLQTKYFTLHYGNGRYIGVSDDKLFSTETGEIWQVANFPDGIMPTVTKYENGKFKMYYYTLDSQFIGAQGVMVSEDGDTWFDITDELLKNINVWDFFILNDRYVTISRNGDVLNIKSASKIDQQETVWEDMPQFKKDGYSFNYGVYYTEDTVGVNLYHGEGSGENIYYVTDDFINWEEKDWTTFEKEMTFANDFFSEGEVRLPVDSSIFDGVETLPYADDNGIYPVSFVNISEDGENWEREPVKIWLGDKLMNKPPQGQVAISDIGEYEWAREAIELAIAKGYMSSKADYENYEFMPGKEALRWEFVAAIVDAMRLAQPEDDDPDFQPFRDVFMYLEWGNSINLAKRLGLINGVGDNRFEPFDNITREDMMTVTYNMLNKLGKIEPDEGNVGLLGYGDADMVSEYAKQAVSALITNGIIKGDGVNVNPKNMISRAEVAVIVSGIIALD